MRAKTQEDFKRDVYNATCNDYEVVGVYINNKTKVTMRHTICGNCFDVAPNNFLSKGSRCPYCQNRKVAKGFNDIYTTDRHIAEMLLNKDDMYLYTRRSNVKLDWICPQCKNIVRGKTPDKVSTYGLKCPFCSDGISYPNKFVHHMFSQVINQIENYTAEYSPSWAKMKRYDNYFEVFGRKYILEVDGGLGHGKGVYGSDKSLLEMSLKNDIFKDDLASKHGIQVIRINADYSNMEYMRDSILKSSLNDVLDLSIVDWKQCHICAMKSKKIEAIKLFNQGVKNINDICSKLQNISYNTVYQYLVCGTKYGLCDYNPKNYVLFRRKPRNRKVRVVCLNTQKVYDSVTEAALDNGIKSMSNIVACCTNKYKTAGKGKNGEKLRWSYYDKALKE